MNGNAINKIIDIGRTYSNLDFHNIKNELELDSLHQDLFDMKTSKLTKEELKDLLHGAIIVEMALGGINGYGSATPTIKIYTTLIALDYEEAINVIKWARRYGFKNLYFPYGTVVRKLIYHYRDILYYSKNEKEIYKAKEYLDQYDNEQFQIAKRIEKEQQKAQERREYQNYLKQNNRIDNENGWKSSLYIKLNSLSTFEKLEVMANDTRHSPKFYPSNMAYQISKEDIQKLDNSKRANLRKMFSIKIHGPSPWASFKKKYKMII